MGRDDGEGAVDESFAGEGPALVLGLMSGTSLDGLDVAAVQLRCRGGRHWGFELVDATTIAYPEPWRERLVGAFASTGYAGHAMDPALDRLDREYGHWLGERASAFARERGLAPALVASHGHTVHHRPAEGYTRQIGNAQALHAACGTPVVADFRRLDVSLGGQGAPLVPLVDRLLFGTYAQCLNLGGFANVSYEARGLRVAYDITVANGLLNRLAEATGRPYDAGGGVARGGSTDDELHAALEALPFYRAAPPKSLGREWVETSVWPLFAARGLAPADGLATATAHIAARLADALAAGPPGEILVTGGGAYNDYLLDRTRERLPGSHRLVLPEGGLIDYKEAIAFALLGALRVRGEATALASVTGARRDSAGGVVVGYRTAAVA